MPGARVALLAVLLAVLLGGRRATVSGLRLTVCLSVCVCLSVSPLLLLPPPVPPQQQHSPAAATAGAGGPQPVGRSCQLDEPPWRGVRGAPTPHRGGVWGKEVPFGGEGRTEGVLRPHRRV